MSNYKEQFDWIKEAWSHTPAVVTTKEIYSLSDFPRWEDCQKDHIYVGFIKSEQLDKDDPDFEGIEGDLIYFVKHRMSGMLEVTSNFSHFRKEEVLDPRLGLVPRGNQMCPLCNDFATRVDSDGCLDCKEVSI